MNSHRPNRIFSALFVLVLFSIAIISDFKLMKFYINGETDYNEWNASTDSKFETDYISNFWLKYQYVNFNGLISRALRQHEMNGVVKLNNGYLTTILPELTDETIQNIAYRTGKANEVLQEKKIQYVYCVLPYVVDKYDDQLPTGIVDYGNNNLDQIKEELEEKSVDVYDYREALISEGIKTYDIFYKTDHHWTTRGGFWAYQKIMHYLSEKSGFMIDQKICNIDNYSITTYPKWHLGSRGQRTGRYYAGIDDFDLIIPKFDTYIESFDGTKAGTLQEMMINMEPLYNRVYTSRYTYDYVLGDVLGNWHNPNASVDKTIVIIGDSMSKAVCPYMTLTFANVLFIDRDVSLINDDYIQQYNPDIILSFYYPGNVGKEMVYNWNVQK